MARPTMPGGVTAGDWILETWGDRTQSVLDWIGQDHATWTPVIQTTLGGTVDSTTTYAKAVKIGSFFVAIASVAIDKAITAQPIYCTTPYTLVNQEAVWGGFRYNNAGNLLVGWCGIASSTTRVAFQRDNETTEMNVATTVNDDVRLWIAGFWE